MQAHRIQVGPVRRAVAWSLGLVAALVRCGTGLHRTKGRADSNRRLLILEPYGMGDVISLEPLIRNLGQAGWQVIVAAQPRWRPLFEGVSHVQWTDATIPWADYESRKKYQFKRFLSPAFRSCLHRLRAVGKDSVGIDPRGDIRSVILLHLAGCRRVLSFEGYLGTDLALPRFSATTIPFSDDLMRWQLNLRFLEELGIAGGDLRQPPRLELLKKSGCQRESRRLGLVPVAPWAGKHWGADKWIPFIERARSQGWRPVGLCGPGQAAAAAGQLGPGVDLEEYSDLNSWAGGLQRCACVVTLDSGPMHLADALGIPVIALFGQGKLPLWAPSGPRSQVIHHQHDADFTHCHQIDRNVPLGRKFMSRIEVEEVLNRLGAFPPG